MSLIAGVYTLEKSTPLDRSWLKAIQQSISRRHDMVETYEDPCLFLAKVDVDAFKDRAFENDRYAVTVTGEPLVAPNPGRPNSRKEDIAYLSRELGKGNTKAMRECVGVFSLCWFDPVEKSLQIYTDRVGVRAVYYSVQAPFVFFSSNLRVLESLDVVPKRMDVRAIAEIVSLGIPLADRTPFADVKVLRGGQYLHCVPGHVGVAEYFRWDELPANSMGRGEVARAAHEAFMSAIASRSARDQSAVSFLSGGLDSRVIVAGLRSIGKQAHTITLEYPNLLDGVIARRFAAVAGTHHIACPVGHATRGPQAKTILPSKVRYREDCPPHFPSLVFSGDGGSVGVGGVYLTKEIVGLLRGDREDEAIELYLRRGLLSKRMFKRSFYERISSIPARGIKEELARIQIPDPAKRFYVFLLDNDQRRHLHYMYEDLDQHRIEFLLPFFDGQFLEVMNSAPVDSLLLHGFYYEWLQLFPGAASVPWQAYPGHLPCPLDLDTKHRSQWEIVRGERFASSSYAFENCKRVLLGRKFPSGILNRSVLFAAFVLHSMKLRNYSHLWKASQLFFEYFARCRGEMVYPELGEPSSLISAGHR